jgi:hypothetical protein
MKATAAARSSVSAPSSLRSSSCVRNRRRGLYSGANPIGQTSAGSPRQIPARRASLSDARSAMSSLAIVFLLAPLYSALRDAPVHVVGLQLREVEGHEGAALVTGAERISAVRAKVAPSARHALGTDTGLAASANSATRCAVRP